MFCVAIITMPLCLPLFPPFFLRSKELVIKDNACIVAGGTKTKQKMKWQWDEELCLTNRCVRNYSVLFGPQAHNGQMRSLCVRLSLSHTSSLEESQLSHFLYERRKAWDVWRGQGYGWDQLIFPFCGISNVSYHQTKVSLESDAMVQCIIYMPHTGKIRVRTICMCP